MATHEPKRKGKKKWHARVKRQYVTYHLGWCETKDEAQGLEREFAERWPART